MTLHVGAGTFLPVKDDDACRHAMHTEHFEIRRTTAARAAESRTGSIETGGQRFTTYLTGERVAVPAKASGNTAAKVPAEGKRLRTDLVLHTR